MSDIVDCPEASDDTPPTGLSLRKVVISSPGDWLICTQKKKLATKLTTFKNCGLEPFLQGLI